MKLFLRSLNMK